MGDRIQSTVGFVFLACVNLKETGRSLMRDLPAQAKTTHFIIVRGSLVLMEWHGTVTVVYLLVEIKLFACVPSMMLTTMFGTD